VAGTDEALVVHAATEEAVTDGGGGGDDPTETPTETDDNGNGNGNGDEATETKTTSTASPAKAVTTTATHPKRGSSLGSNASGGDDDEKPSTAAEETVESLRTEVDKWKTRAKDQKAKLAIANAKLEEHKKESITILELTSQSAAAIMAEQAKFEASKAEWEERLASELKSWQISIDNKENEANIAKKEAATAKEDANRAREKANEAIRDAEAAKIAAREAEALKVCTCPHIIHHDNDH
jgi:hypothetical protein